MLIHAHNIEYVPVTPPTVVLPNAPKDLSDAVYSARLANLCTSIQTAGLDAVLIYADREHGGNFGYIAGFEPRFEEACLVVHADSRAWVLLGNECLKMHAYSRIAVTPVHVPYFSLPNQPMDGEQTMADCLRAAAIAPGMKIGLMGWKVFTGRLADGARMFDVPHFIVEAAAEVTGSIENITNAARLMMAPDCGLRAIHGAEEIAQYEFAASMAAHRVWQVLEEVDIGKTEHELADHLAACGQPLSCYSMCATGDRFTNAVVFPRSKAVARGDKFTVSMGLRGGLTCRAGYAAASADELPENVRDYVDALAKPYFAASATWYSTLAPGVTGGEVYAAVDSVLPKAEYGWQLNPGHLTAMEEWLSSPIEKDSAIPLRSGMILQMDIIPRKAPYGGVSAEDGVALADADLRYELETRFPETWARMQRRRRYMIDVLGIPLDESVLPMSDTVGYLRPLLLARGAALRVARAE